MQDRNLFLFEFTFLFMFELQKGGGESMKEHFEDNIENICLAYSFILKLIEQLAYSSASLHFTFVSLFMHYLCRSGRTNNIDS
jgi:hypothetical protein